MRRLPGNARAVPSFVKTPRREGKEQQIKTTTGLPIAPPFSASKMRWLLESTPEGVQLADQGEICLGTIDALAAMELDCWRFILLRLL